MSRLSSSKKAENRRDFTRMVCDGPEGQRLWHHLRPLVAGGTNGSKLRLPQAESVVIEVDEWATAATREQVDAFLEAADHDWGTLLVEMMPHLDPVARSRLKEDQVRVLLVLAVREAMAELDYPEADQAALVCRFTDRAYHRERREPKRPRVDVDAVVVVRRRSR